MKNRNFRNTLAFVFSIVMIFVKGQDIEKISQSICNSLDQSNHPIPQKINSETLNYLESYSESHFITKSDFNRLYLQIQNHLIKNCDKSTFTDGYSLLPIASIADTEHLFQQDQLVELEKKLKELKSKNRLQTFIITISDYFPNRTIEEYSFSIVNKNYNPLYKNGAVIIVVNTKQREIRISTNTIAQQKISDEFCSNLIDNVMLPLFKEEKYVEGINKAVLYLQNKIQE